MAPVWHLSFILLAVVFCIRNGSTRFVPYAPSFQQNGDSPFVPVPSADSNDDFSVADKTEKLISGWRRLNDQDKQAFFEEQNQQGLTNSITEEYSTAKAYSTKIYDTVDFYSYYSYLYYYPTMDWFLDKTPDTDDYWVGIYKVGGGDREYLAYKYLGKTAQGSYRIGKLSATAGIESRNRYDKFELRLYKGSYQRVDAVTNLLHGVVRSPPVDVPSDATVEEADYNPPIEPKLQAFLSALEKAEASNENRGVAPPQIEVSSDARVEKADYVSPNDPKLQAFLSALENVETSNERPSKSVQYSRKELSDLWSQFDSNEQQLLLPILEQDSLPDHIKKPSIQSDDRPEPKLLYPDLGTQPALLQATDPAKQPNKITLTVELDYSYTYVYPVVNTKTALSGKYSWLGVYRTKETQSFSPNGYLSWQWVGPGYAKKTYLSNIKEDKAGPTSTTYVGPIFDWVNGAYRQIGFASSIIEATVSVTPAAPIPKFNAGFNVQQALTFAYLSQLAYKSYSTVTNKVKDYKLNADLQIYSKSTDTHGFIASNATTLVVVFRGTASFTNALTDVSFIHKKVVDSDSAYCHGGFVNALNSVYTSIETCVKPHLGKKKLFITGHSLGGALASLVTYRLSLKYSFSQPTMFVYGCPPVGDKDFSDYFEGMSSYVITNDGDPVSTGALTTTGPWVGLYKPLDVYYLQKGAGHGIQEYIDQLKKL